MDIKVTPLKETSQVQLEIAVTPEELEPHVERAARRLSKDKPLKGFRPGKAPAKVVMEALGKDLVLTEVLEKGIPHWFVQAILEHDIEALGRPATTIEAADLEQGVRFTAIVDVLPEVKLGDVSQLSVERRPVNVSDEDVDRELKALAKSRSTYIDIARPATQGDTVVVDFEVSMNGTAMEGGASKNHPVHLGEGHFIPDFEQKLQGIQAGDEREFDMTFPEDFGREEFRGKQAHAKVKAHEVKKRVIPDLTDDFAKSLGKFDSLKHLQDELKVNMQREHEEKEQDRLQGELTDKLAEKTTFGPLPESLIEREIDRRLQELLQLLAYQQKTLEQYLQAQKKTPEQLRQELREPAIQTVKVSLALRQFAQEQGIEVTDEEVQKEVDAYLRHYGDIEKAKQEIDQDELKSHLKATIRNRRALKKLEELAQITEAKPAKKEEKTKAEEKTAS